MQSKLNPSRALCTLGLEPAQRLGKGRRRSLVAVDVNPWLGCDSAGFVQPAQRPFVGSFQTRHRVAKRPTVAAVDGLNPKLDAAVHPAGNGGAITALAAFKAIGTTHRLIPDIFVNLCGKLKRDRRILGMKPKAFAFTGVLVLAFVVIGWPIAGQAAELSGDTVAAQKGNITIHPINHATLALHWSGTTIYVDPVGGASRFKGLPVPGLILLTDTHGDHLNRETLEAVAGPDTKVLAPPAVAEQLPPALRERTTVLTNGQSAEVLGIPIDAVAAYNTTPQRQQFHAKGRGNGYLVTLGGKRVYISGDTENTPEMAALKNIDVAFLCMNLPYTMTVEQAAEAVRAFKPKIVYPYHSRGSDLEKFKALVGADAGVEVRLRDWYATK